MIIYERCEVETGVKCEILRFLTYKILLNKEESTVQKSTSLQKAFFYIKYNICLMLVLFI